jgi:hypothetical protein
MLVSAMYSLQVIRAAVYFTGIQLLWYDGRLGKSTRHLFVAPDNLDYAVEVTELHLEKKPKKNRKKIQQHGYAGAPPVSM